MIIKHTYILVLGLLLLVSFSYVQNSETSSVIQLLTTQTHFEAGNIISLKFSNPNNNKPLLYCTNSYGSILIEPKLDDNTLLYVFPESFCKKRGIIQWQLSTTSLSGQLHITPIQQTAKIETYVGPPSIQAGNKDFSMLTVIPTDSLDNPLAENTLVTIKHLFLDQKKNDLVYTKNLIAYQNIYAPQQSGRILISSNCLDKNSKEFTVIVHPSNPTDFKIFAKRNHEYADGNQVTTFYSSIVKDGYNNVVSDGTFVTFFIKNEKGNSLKTTGTTIEGIATAKIIHPDYKTTWSVKAYVEGLAESNTISLNYKQAVKDFEVNFYEKNRTLKIGPLQSFMVQMIPDGLEVTLLVYKNDTLINTETKTSYNGFATFKLNTAVYPEDNYTMKIKTAELEKEFKNIKVW